jgi:hypothetical protein
MNSLVDALASRFIGAGLNVTERLESFSPLAGASPCRRLLILAGDDDTGRGAFLRNGRLTVRNIGQDAS